MNRICFLLIVTVCCWISSCKTHFSPSNATKSIREEFNKMAWLEGIWAVSNDTIKKYESWKRTSDTLLEGFIWEIKARDSVPGNRIQIMTDEDGIQYKIELAAKNEGISVTFKLIANRNGEHVFENQAHEFPQRILDALRPDGSLYLRTEGIQDGQPRYIETLMTKIR
jgi:hypothetical protein